VALHRLEQAADPSLNAAVDPSPNVTHLEQAANPGPNTDSTQATNSTSSRPLAWSDVFVDDHIALAQGTLARLQHVCRILMHNIDRVFHPLEFTDRATWQEPISKKNWPLVMATGQHNARFLVGTFTPRHKPLPYQPTMLPAYTRSLLQSPGHAPAFPVDTGTSCWVSFAA